MSETNNPKKETITKVLEFIKQQSPVTPTQISSIGIDYNSVNASLEFLEKLGHIRIITNGHTKLVEVIRK